MPQTLTARRNMDQYKHPASRMLFSAVLALAASALLLVVVYALHRMPQILPDANRSPPKVIPGKSLHAVIGGAQPRGERLEVSAYQRRGSEYHALAVWRGSFQAEDHPLLTYQVETGFPGPMLELIWWTASDPQTPHSIKLNRTDSGEPWMDMARNPEWRGTVIEVGVHVIAAAPDQQSTITRLAFEPYSWRGVFASHWSSWTAFRGWSPNSINYQYGTPDRNGLSPVLAAAAWSVLAAMLLLVAGAFSGGILPGALIVVVLLPWLWLDLQWQKELLTQLSQTRDQFAGKTAHEKHLADIDSDIYYYITRLKTTVLPKEPSRIVILQDSTGHNFERLKAQYYLLPNSVFNLGAAPRTVGLANLNYILVLGEVPGLEFRADTNTLVWEHGKKTLRVRLEDEDPMGKLYKVRHPRRTGDHKKP
jgi:hypothetical protein